MMTLTTGEPGNAGAFDHTLTERKPVTGHYSLPPSASRPSCTDGEWKIDVELAEHRITRSVHYGGNAWSVYKETEETQKTQDSPEVIWPTWPTTVAEEIATSSSPLAELQQHWDTAIGRLRDSAKWMATVLGAALASVIPTVPLADLNKRHISGLHAFFGIAGIVSLAVTLLLVLLVMRPHSVSYDDIARANRPAGIRQTPGKADGEHKWYKHVLLWYERAFPTSLCRWQQTVLANPDLYLPCGIDSLGLLRQAIVAEELTLVALARAKENADTKEARGKLTEAQSARAARLHELRTSAASIVTIGTFYSVRAQSSWATFGGVIFGLLGIVGIVVAVA